MWKKMSLIQFFPYYILLSSFYPLPFHAVCLSFSISSVRSFLPSFILPSFLPSFLPLFFLWLLVPQLFLSSLILNKSLSSVLSFFALRLIPRSLLRNHTRWAFIGTITSKGRPSELNTCTAWECYHHHWEVPDWNKKNHDQLTKSIVSSLLMFTQLQTI